MPFLESTLADYGLWALIGYLLGSIPFGIILARIMGLGDLRKIGSGNIGATNVLRTGNKTAAVLTLLLDGGKGAAAVLIARMYVAEDAVQVAAFAAFMGHLFPIWLGFRGGKGVATYLGIFLAFHWPLGLALCGTWLAMAYATRYSSVAALSAAGSAPIWMILLGGMKGLILAGLLLGFMHWKHKANLQRLKDQTEPKIGEKT